jgi:predicted  nucleic acid-binding Zn-ribbon protein
MSDTPISDSTPHNVADLGMLCRRLERELTAANERIKRLEDALEARASDNELNQAWELYIKTKEAKP